MATVALAYAEVLDLIARGRDSAVYVQILRLGARPENIVVADSCLHRIRQELQQSSLDRMDLPTARDNLDQLERRLDANHRIVRISAAVADEANRLRAAHPEDDATPPEDWALYAALLTVGSHADATLIARAPPRAVSERLKTSRPAETAPTVIGRALFDAGRDLRILCVSGGGYRGLFAARVLSRLEQSIRDRVGPEAAIADVYGLYAGASIGAILAAAVALRIPARRLERYLRSPAVARTMFRRSLRSRLVSGAAIAACLLASFVGVTYLGFVTSARVNDPGLRAFAVFGSTIVSMAMVALAVAATSLTFAGVQAPNIFRAKYSNVGLRKVVERIFGAHARRRLRDIHVPIAIVATNYNLAEPHVFRSAGLDPHQPSDVTLCDAILASAASPTFFPAYRIGDTSYVDGGVVANVPDVVAVCDAVGHLYASHLNARMLSVGVETEDRTGGPAAPGSAGALMWFARHNLLGKIFAAQEALAASLAETLLAERYVRVRLAPQKTFARHIRRLDGHSPKSRKSLIALADGAWERQHEVIRRSRLAG